MALDWSRNPKAPLVVDGARLEYACYGPAPDLAPTIVMLHEGLGCVGRWKDFPEQVAKASGMGVFVYSRQGHGASDPSPLPKPIDCLTQEAMQVLPQVLDALGFRSGLLFGHSDGATIAAVYAGSVEDFRVRGLILMAPHFFAEPEGLAEIAAAREAFANGDLRKRMMKYHRDPENTFRGWNDVWLDPAFAEWDITDVIDYFRVPCLAIQGRDDQFGSLAQIQIIDDRSYAPVELVVLDDCQHSPHFDQPEKTLDLVAEFTARLQRIEAAEVEIA